MSPTRRQFPVKTPLAFSVKVLSESARTDVDAPVAASATRSRTLLLARAASVKKIRSDLLDHWMLPTPVHPKTLATGLAPWTVTLVFRSRSRM